MKWEFKSPVFGDMIRVKAGQIYHFGIFASEDEVLQFGLAPIARPTVSDRDVEVCTSTLADFCCGYEVEVGECETDTEKESRRSPEETVAAARARLGEKNYSILYNNCEHFAYKCATGKHFCSQTFNVREIFRSFPVVDLYIIKEENENSERLLVEYALNRSFGKKPADAALELKEGAWSSSVCKIALERYGSLLLVCVSRADIKLEATDALDGEEYGAFNDFWTGKICVSSIECRVKITTPTPQKVRTYTNLSI